MSAESGGGLNPYERELIRMREGSATSESHDLPLFEPQVRLMARRQDPDTSKEAALFIADNLPRLQRSVLSVFLTYGPMTAKAAERLPEFETYGFSTVRKRISELAGRGFLRDTGQRAAGSMVYEAVTQSSMTTGAAA